MWTYYHSLLPKVNLQKISKLPEELVEEFVSLKVKSIWKRIKELREEGFDGSNLNDKQNEEAIRLLNETINQEFLRCHQNEDTVILIQLKHEFDALTFMYYSCK